jgi:hypothetical protein
MTCLHYILEWKKHKPFFNYLSNKEPPGFQHFSARKTPRCGLPFKEEVPNECFAEKFPAAG